jgi:hypothetical protein
MSGLGWVFCWAFSSETEMSATASVDHIHF